MSSDNQEQETSKSYKIIENGKEMAREIGIKTSHYLIASVGLVTALSWNDTMKDGMKTFFPMPKSNLKANVIYSVLITIFLILLIWTLPDTKSELPEPAQKKLEIIRYDSKKKLEEIKNDTEKQKLNSDKLYSEMDFNSDK